MQVEQMKAAILAVYPGEKWRIRVSFMTDEQIFAIYQSFVRSGKIK